MIKMANKWVHILVGALTGTGYMHYCTKITGRLPTQDDLIKAVVLGCLGGVLPDLLEPANNPYHRKFFHSIMLFLMISYINQKLIGNSNLNGDAKLSLSLLNVGYLSHLILDSSTYMGLPFFNELF